MKSLEQEHMELRAALIILMAIFFISIGFGCLFHSGPIICISFGIGVLLFPVLHKHLIKYF